MAYELELPRDVQTDIDEFLETFSGTARGVVRNEIIAELTKLQINPRLGTRMYGGPSERRLFHWFRIEVEGRWFDLHVAYRFNETDKLVTVHGFRVEGSA